VVICSDVILLLICHGGEGRGGVTDVDSCKPD